MNKRRRIFFIIFGTYHLFVLVFVIFIEAQKEDLSLLYGLYSKISLMRNGAILGLGLFIIDFVWNWLEKRSERKQHDIMRHENNTLKAKVYDLQQAQKEAEKVISSAENKSK
jgi:ABC-type transport system involved in cytochrome bd biosynthesis fused ATPase/permease subunit